MSTGAVVRQPRIAIVAAGISGICLGANLLRAGLRDFTIYEKAHDYGGTWRDNTYPGLVCDVPSRYYQFTFAKNPDWTRLYPTGGEIKDYLVRVAREHGLDNHIRFGAEVLGARFGDSGWSVTTAEGDERFDFLVCATGFLHRPRIPDIAGLDSFGGPVFHSSRWDHRVELDGKRVGIIGSGSTGTQLVNALAGRVPRVTLFQRTPQWILPTANRPVSALTRMLHKRIPALGSLTYLLWRESFGLFSKGLIAPGLTRKMIGRVVTANLRTVRDPELRRKLTPDYEPMCKRLVVSDGFYRAVQRPDVELVTAGIDHVDATGVVTVDGAHHPLDILVLATGFDSHAYMRPMAITGARDRTLDQAWAAGPHAFQGFMIPEFPNLFTMIGPYSPFANHPLTAVAELQSWRIMSWIKRWRAGEFDTVEPTATAHARFLATMRAAMPGTVWTSGCQSWYLGADGLPELWPSSPAAYEKLIRRPPDLTDYHLGLTASGDAPPR
ncbi:NAD(P)/FAD-dependent oxidoreductase [Nocardia sp. XZ_19_385]|uniref:flavin-containing monooxygenase n=1 Tax=Nocardia sp. XZ_19_385 TaxID=2769488 RepID=UPI00188E58D4|nr:NAD(P)/FAD-dependent oxidoreductase [Nocardia sp. XZ_19_385]